MSRRRLGNRPVARGCATNLFGERRWATERSATVGEAWALGGVLELSGGLICFGGCAPGTPLLGDDVVLVEALMP